VAKAGEGDQNAALDLRDIDLIAYTWVLTNRSTDAEELALATGLSAAQAAESLARLVAARLVAVDTDNPGLGYGVAPELAGTRLIAPVEAEIRRHEERIAVVRAQLDRFSDSYFRAGRSTTESLEVLSNVEEVRALLTRLSARCAREMISSQPGGGARKPEAMQEAIGRDRSMLERGIRIRTLYHHTARFNGPSQAYVAAASALGAEYRTAHELFGRLIVFDRAVAFVPLQDESWGAVVIREPHLVGYLCDIFEQSWNLATPFADAASQGLERVSREIHETILRLLAAGLKDETIARRLGMSLRTARRHIADLMEQLGATSRFQAGAAAAAAGLLGPEPAGSGSAVTETGRRTEA
jgi:DNA-binding CsgD family transcriptional regulator